MTAELTATQTSFEGEEENIMKLLLRMQGDLNLTTKLTQVQAIRRFEVFSPTALKSLLYNIIRQRNIESKVSCNMLYQTIQILQHDCMKTVLLPVCFVAR